jgi:hypothetical protein
MMENSHRNKEIIIAAATYKGEIYSKEHQQITA